jgi:Flp pilus assembly protein TadB
MSSIMGAMVDDERRSLRGWKRNLHSARQHPGLYRLLTAFFAAAVILNLVLIVSNAVAGKWGRVAWGAVILVVAAVLLRIYLALVRQEPRPPRFVFGSRARDTRKHT